MCDSRFEVIDDPTCEEFDLRNCEVGEASARILARHLATSSSLRRLTLMRTSLLPKGASVLAVSIAMHPVLEVLDLGVNSLGDEGTAAIAQALKTNTVLRSLSLFGNSVDAE